VTIDAPSTPASLRWAVWVLAGEAAALGVIAGYLAYLDLTSTVTDLTSALIVTGFAAGAAVLLAVLARAVHRCRAAARAPAIVLQLMLLPIGYYMTIGGLAWLGLPLIGLGLATVTLLVMPASTRAFELDRTG
jgi:hypothetical protein